MMIVLNTNKLLSDQGTKRQSLLNYSFDDNQIKEIESAIDGIEENNKDMLDIFFVERYDKDDKTKKPDSRRKIFKILSKYHTQEFPAFKTYETAKLSAVVASLAKEKNTKIDAQATEELVNRLGNDIRAFDTELDKLSTYAHPEKVITKQMVMDICSSKEDLFNLTDYIMVQDKTKTIAELRSLLSTKHALAILFPLQTMLKQWIFMKLNSTKMSYSEIGMKLGRMHEYRVKLAIEKMKNTPLKYLVDLRTKLAKAEYNIKSGLSFGPEEELENAIIG